MLYVAPRSTWINCGSMPAALAQRVPVLPSTASAQGNCGVGEQVVGRFRARLVVCAPTCRVAGSKPTIRASTSRALGRFLKTEIPAFRCCNGSKNLFISNLLLYL